jgi:SAM-dependent methyltransferase
MGSAMIQGDLWGRAPSDWALLQEPKHIPLFEAMLSAANVGKNTRLLDAGCGGGGASVLAARRGARVTGLDAAKGLIEFAQQRLPSGDFRVGDIEELPFEDEVFDVVIAANSLQYAEDRVAALRELGRVCKSQGKIVIGLFGPAERVEYRSIFMAVRNALPEPPPGDGPFGLSGPGKLERLLKEAGLTVMDRGEVNCPFSYPDVETFWRANASAGPFQATMRTIGEDGLKSTLLEASLAFRNGDGSIEIAPNIYRYTVSSA